MSRTKTPPLSSNQGQNFRNLYSQHIVPLFATLTFIFSWVHFVWFANSITEEEKRNPLLLCNIFCSSSWTWLNWSPNILVHPFMRQLSELCGTLLWKLIERKKLNFNLSFFCKKGGWGVPNWSKSYDALFCASKCLKIGYGNVGSGGWPNPKVLKH